MPPMEWLHDYQIATRLAASALTAAEEGRWDDCAVYLTAGKAAAVRVAQSGSTDPRAARAMAAILTAEANVWDVCLTTDPSVS